MSQAWRTLYGKACKLKFSDLRLSSWSERNAHIELIVSFAAFIISSHFIHSGEKAGGRQARYRKATARAAGASRNNNSTRVRQMDSNGTQAKSGAQGPARDFAGLQVQADGCFGAAQMGIVTCQSVIVRNYMMYFGAFFITYGSYNRVGIESFI